MQNQARWVQATEYSASLSERYLSRGQGFLESTSSVNSPGEAPLRVLWLSVYSLWAHQNFPSSLSSSSTQFPLSSNCGPDAIGVASRKNATVIIGVQYKPRGSKNICFHLFSEHVTGVFGVIALWEVQKSITEFLPLERLYSRRKGKSTWKPLVWD